MKRRSDLRIRVICSYLRRDGIFCADNDNEFEACEGKRSFGSYYFDVPSLPAFKGFSSFYGCFCTDTIRVNDNIKYELGYKFKNFSSLFVVSVAILSLLINPPLHLMHHAIQRPPNTQNIVCVPGRGFSGFWYAFGMLKSMNNDNSKQDDCNANNKTSTHDDSNDYYCYSSGCLCAAASLANKSFDDVLNAAVEAQDRWQVGEITRYNIVPLFVDTILNDTRGDEDAKIFDRLNILLTTKGSGVTAKRAQTFTELRELLIQTTWIPFVTGGRLWMEDASGEFHMDGAFSSTLHPPCDKRIDVPYTFDVVRNILNPNFGENVARLYFQDGMRHGQSVISRETER